MGNSCTTVLTKDSIEENINIKKETYDYKLYKKSRTKKTKKTRKTKVVNDNSIIHNSLEKNNFNKPKNLEIQESLNNNLNKISINHNHNKSCNKSIDTTDQMGDKKKIRKLNNYINQLEEELMSYTITTIKEKIENLNKEKDMNNKVNKLKNKNAKLFKNYIELKNSIDS